MNVFNFEGKISEAEWNIARYIVLVDDSLYFSSDKRQAMPVCLYYVVVTPLLYNCAFYAVFVGCIA